MPHVLPVGGAAAAVAAASAMAAPPTPLRRGGHRGGRDGGRGRGGADWHDTRAHGRRGSHHQANLWSAHHQPSRPPPPCPPAPLLGWGL